MTWSEIPRKPGRWIWLRIGPSNMLRIMRLKLLLQRIQQLCLYLVKRMQTQTLVQAKPPFQCPHPNSIRQAKKLMLHLLFIQQLMQRPLILLWVLPQTLSSANPPSPTPPATSIWRRNCSAWISGSSSGCLRHRSWTPSWLLWTMRSAACLMPGPQIRTT
ncbi:hypothetical protein D3C75_740180 [compost metagenome]